MIVMTKSWFSEPVDRNLFHEISFKYLEDEINFIEELIFWQKIISNFTVSFIKTRSLSYRPWFELQLRWKNSRFLIWSAHTFSCLFPSNVNRDKRLTQRMLMNWLMLFLCTWICGVVFRCLFWEETRFHHNAYCK